jgi:uncharacterized RDD family membrane protein YckC
MRNGMKRFIRLAISFLAVFFFVFFLGGWFLMPYLPPVPDHPVSSLQLEYWETNWIGALLGLILASFSCWADLRRMRGAPPAKTTKI